MATTLPPRPDHPPTARRRPLAPASSVAACGPTCRPRSSSRTRSAPARASSPPRARSSSGPASTPVARPRTSSSSTSHRAATRSGGASVNRPISEAHYDRLRARLVAYCAEQGPVRPGLLIGADPAHQRRLRVYTETAWASVFARNLFRRPTAADAGRLRAELHDHLRAVVPGRPGDRGHPDRARRSCSTSSGWRSSSSAPSTPARSRRAPSRS